MTSFLLEPTAIAKWQRIVQEASQQLSIELSSDLESYLVFLLMRFTTANQLADDILALEYLASMQQVGITRINGLRDVGDKCLILSGLFPEQAEKRLVTTSYFIDLGQGAYSAVANAECQSTNVMRLYNDLCAKFVNLSTILNTIKDPSTLHLKRSDSDKYYLSIRH